MAAPQTEGEAIARRLLSEPAIVALVGQCVWPTIPDTDPESDYVIFYRVSGGAGTNLSETRRLRQTVYRLDVYAESDERAERILAACRVRLFGDSRAAVPSWRERADGVQACIPVEDEDNDVDAERLINGFSLSLSFCPQPLT